MKLSIITATFNSEDTLRRCLDSVAEQTALNNIEHLIIDGGSEDETVGIAAEYPHVAYCVSERDRGVYHAFNKGLAAATGDLLYFLNSDDYLHESTTVEEIIVQLSSGADFLSGRILVVNHISGQTHVSPSKAAAGDRYKPPHPGFVCHRRVFEKIGPFNECLSIAADTYLMKRAIDECRGIFSEQVLATFSQDGVSSKPENRSTVIKQDYIIDWLLNEKTDSDTMETRLASQIAVTNALKNLVLSAFNDADNNALERFSSQRIGIFGYRQVSQICMRLLEHHDIPVICYVASDTTSLDTIVSHPVIRLDNAKELNLDILIVGVEGDHKSSIISDAQRALPDVSVLDWMELASALVRQP